MSQNNNDAAYEYFNAAVRLNPDNADAAMLLAPLRMYLSNPELSDSAWRQKSLDMMRRYVDRYPDDIDEGLQYALNERHHARGHTCQGESDGTSARQ